MQRWVLTVLAVTVVGHFAAGLIGFAIVMDDAKLSSRIGLNVMAAVVSILLVGGVRAIHQKTILSLWPGLGLLVGALGLYLTFSVRW